MKMNLSFKQGRVLVGTLFLAALCSVAVHAQPVGTGHYADPMDGLCEDAQDHQDFQKCLSGIEQKYLQQNATIAKRQDLELCIQATQGQPVCFTDNLEDSDAVARYRYMGQFNALPIAVVYSSHWEWSTYHLISTKTGTVLLEVDSGPTEFAVSPDGKHMAVSSQDIDEIYNPNALWIYQMQEDKPWEQVGEVVMQQEAAVELGWTNNTTLNAVKRTYFIKDGEDVTQVQDVGKMAVVFDGKAWGVAAQ